MQFDWSTLGGKAPTALVRARNFAHHAVQWVARAARANLAAAPDDSHSSLEWDVAHGALVSRPLPAAGADVRVGLRISGLALIILRGSAVLDTFELAGRRDSMIAVWLDSALRALGLKPASGITLPYSMLAHSVGRGGAYSYSGEAEAIDELARWYGAAADVLGEVKTKLAGVRPGPVYCWPHHFDIATLVSLEDGAAETARSVGIGVSPGDEYYSQPYAYISPWPRLQPADLPVLPPPGHWHTQGFVAAVATGEEILMLEDRRLGLLNFINGAFDIGFQLVARPIPLSRPNS
jgi:hypothetical protein